MCGIFAYTGKKEALPILLDGLTTLEYRGYDSAGIFVPGIGVIKAVGAVSNLKKKIADAGKGAGNSSAAPGDGKKVLHTSGIAHTRWATHGEPTELNAHPHGDCTGGIYLIHNGIIENYKEIKDALAAKGHKFLSVTDSEVFAHLVEEHYKSSHDFEKAVFASLKEITGTYGIAIMHADEPGKIIVARMGSPIALGIGDGEMIVASDASPILRHTKSVVYLLDGEVAILTPESYRIMTLDSVAVERAPQIIEGEVEQAKKGGYEHFMLKEIMEGPEVIRNTIRGRLLLEEGNAKLGGLEAVAEELRGVKRIVIVACGTAYYSGVVAKYLFEEYAGIPTEVEVASEFRYRDPIILEGTALLAISQSGETADTLAAIREAKRKGALTLGIVNAVGSTIARETDAGVYNHAGPEIGVASTKAFISQLSAVTLFALFLGRQRTLTLTRGKELALALRNLPEQIEQILEKRETLRELAEKYQHYRDFLYIGRKYNYAIGFEGALKLKECSYIHAEGYGAGEMKHGPLAMIDEQFPTVAIAPKDSVYEKMISNIQEIKARRGKVLAIGTEGDTTLETMADDVFYVPGVLEPLSPILSVVPLQLFAYYTAAAKGLDVDRPRNLAKSVTVE